MARTSVLRSKTLAQGGIHFRRASEIIYGVPAQPAAWGAAKMLEFEVAAALRDQIIQLRGREK